MVPPRPLLALCAAALCAQAARIDPVAAGEAPVIAIIGTPGLETPDCITLRETAGDDGFSCFVAMYPEWLAGAAARVVAIPYDMADRAPALLDDVFASVNGVFLTGGDVYFATEKRTPKVAAYMKTVGVAYDTVLRKHAAGEMWPLWGTCMGLQVLSVIGARNTSVVEMYAYDSDEISLPVYPSRESKTSRLMGAMPGELYAYMATANATVNLHHDGVDPKLYDELPLLRESFRLLGWNVDRKGKPFASIIEHVSAPMYAVQFHPERPTYEVYSKHNGVFDRSYLSIMANDWFSHFFVGLARGNKQTFTDEATWAWAEAHSSKKLKPVLARGSPLDGDLIYMYNM